MLRCFHFYLLNVHVKVGYLHEEIMSMCVLYLDSF